MSIEAQAKVDGEAALPPIDVIELATAILSGGARAETMVSQREIRAMAAALNDFNVVLSLTSQMLFMIFMLGKKPDSKDINREAWRLAAEITQKLKDLGYCDWEDEK